MAAKAVSLHAEFPASVCSRINGASFTHRLTLIDASIVEPVAGLVQY